VTPAATIAVAAMRRNMIERLNIKQDYKPITPESITDCVLSLRVRKIATRQMTYYENVTADLYF
jgi:hypothetical protein